MLVEDGHQRAPKSVDGLVGRVVADQADCAPRVLEHVVDAGAEHPSRQSDLTLTFFALWPVLLHAIIPEDTYILRVYFEKRVVDQVPWDWLTTGWQVLILSMPCLCL